MRRTGAVLITLLLGACAGQHRPLHHPPAIRAGVEVPAADRLDVAIEVFETAVTDDTVPAEVHRLEGRVLPYHLKATLEATGWWGVVRVVPAGASVAEVTISGRLLRSNGRDLALRIEAEDATGRPWLGRRYEGQARADATDDPHQALFDHVANDLLQARRRLDASATERVRTTAALRFAADLAPDAFVSYLRRDRGGRWTVERLPATGDPVMARIDRVRARDEQLVDGLDEYYAALYARVGGSYADWRRRMAEEREAVDGLARSVRTRRLLGAVAIAVGGALLASDEGARAASAGAVGVGTAAILSGGRQKAESKMHRAALGELETDLEEEVAPLLVVIDGGATGTILNPRGEKVFSFEGRKAGFHSIPVAEGTDGKLWKVNRAAGPIRLLTVPPYLARSVGELLLPREVVLRDTEAHPKE